MDLNRNLYVVTNKFIFTVGFFVFSCHTFVQHFPEHNTQRINVTSYGILVLEVNFSRHVAVSASELGKRAGIFFIACHKSRQSKVAQFDIPILIDQQIGGSETTKPNTNQRIAFDLSPFFILILFLISTYGEVFKF